MTFGQAILVHECMVTQKVDMSLWNCDELQLQTVKILYAKNSVVVVNVNA